MKINRQTKHLFQKTPATTFEYDAFRKKLLNWTLLISLFLGVPAVVIGIIESNQLGQNYFIPFYIVVYISIVILFVLRNAISSKAIIIIYLSILYILTIQNFYIYGFIGVAFMLMIFISLMSCAYYGARSGLIAMSLSIIPVLVLAYLHWTSTITISDTIIHNTQTITPWITTITIYSILSFLLLVTIGRFQLKLQEELSKKMKQAEQLYKTNQILKKELTDHEETLSKLNKAKIRAEQSDKLKTAFIENISHEIRTPLNSIVGFSQLLAPEITMDTFSEYKNIIKNSSNQLITIVEDIIEISEIETHQLQLKKEIINLPKLFGEINSTIEYIVTQQKKEHLHIAIKAPDYNSDPFITTDSKRLQQIIEKLIFNAIKFTDKGFIELGYNVININNTKTLRCYVKDSGRGISNKEQKQIFKAFYQIEKGANRDGNGLGLSIIEGLTKMLGGDISVESLVGKGSTFTISIPSI